MLAFGEKPTGQMSCESWQLPGSGRQRRNREPYLSQHSGQQWSQETVTRQKGSFRERVRKPKVSEKEAEP